jgi:hypothetical protein
VFGEAIEIMDGVVVAVNDVDGGDGRVPVSGNDENGSGPRAEPFLLPCFQERPRRYRIVKRQRRRSMRYVESVHLNLFFFFFFNQRTQGGADDPDDNGVE